MPTTLALVDALRERVTRDGLFDAPVFELEEARQMTVVMVVGVNGSGKTTTIGKLAHKYKGDGRNVLMVAGDTFRAAAIDQLRIWSERADVPLISGAANGDPVAIRWQWNEGNAAAENVVEPLGGGRLK